VRGAGYRFADHVSDAEPDPPADVGEPIVD